MQNLKLQLLALWLFNPFISLVVSFKNLNKVGTGYFMLFSFFFGFSFVVSDAGADSGVYAMQLVEYHQKQMSFQELTSNFYSDEGGIDIYQQTVTWFFANFTDDPRWLFGFFAIVFGYFWFKIIKMAKSEIGNRSSLLISLVFLTIIFTNPIWNINGVRMWTATVIFTYGLLYNELNNSKKGWFFALSAIFVHFSLISVIVWYLIYKLFPIKKIELLFALFVITFFVSEIDSQVIKNYFDLLPEVVQQRQKGYVHEDTLERYAAERLGVSKSIHVRISEIVNKYISLILAILFFVFSKTETFKENPVFKKWFKIALFMGVLANLASNIPSGGRFIIVSNLLFFFTLLFFLKYKVQLSRNLKFLITTPFVILVLFSIRTGMDFVSIFFFIGNPITNFFVQDTDPIIETVKSFF